MQTFIRIFAMALVMGAMCFSAPASAEQNRVENNIDDSRVTIWFMNTGKSDCILIQHKDGAALVDTGLAESAPTMLGVLRSAGVTRLDHVFLTHSDKDHIGGLETLLKYIPVEHVYRSTFSDTTKKGENKIDKVVTGAGTTTELLSIGDVIKLTDIVSLTVLAPVKLNPEDDNNNSLVLILEAYGTRTLLTGDMLYDEEKILLRSDKDLSADILKVAHHGRPDATSDAFVDAVSPKYAAILTDRSVKEDSANPIVLERLERIGTETFISDMTEWGVRFEIGSAGNISVDFPEQPDPREDLQSLDALLNRDNQCLTIKNTGTSTITLDGCMIYSEKKGNVYVFPENTALETGSAVTLTGTQGDGMLIWHDVKKPFPKEGEGVAAIYDSYGNLLFLFD